MRAAPDYRFYIQVEEGAKILSHPVWKADMNIDYQAEDGGKYFRRSLSDKLTFLGDDYTRIMGAGYDDTVHVWMEISTDIGLTWEQYWHGTFTRTDCTIRTDDRMLTVQPSVSDEYKAVLDGMEKEFNIIELKPQTDRVKVAKRPLIQIYVPGDTVVSCFISGNSWEEDAEEVTRKSDLVNRYHFSLNTILKEMEVTSSGGLDAAAGTYSGRVTADHNDLWSGKLYNGDRTYYIEVRQTQESVAEYEWQQTSVWLCRASDDAQLYYYEQRNGTFDNKVFTMSPASGSGMTGSMSVDMFTYNMFARLLCDVEQLHGQETNTIPDADIVTNNRNYRRCAGYAVPVTYISNLHSTEPSEYGRRDDGTYFLPPYTAVGNKMFPVAQSTWRYASLWFSHNLVDEETDRRARKQYILRDAYEMASCISVLLGEIAPGITHQATADYSTFLYGDTNPVSGDRWRLYMTQKTNILKGEYSEPAMKAETSLSQILRMLRDVFGLYWFIDGDNRLRIEHISWFLRGGSYQSDIREVGYDLTTMLNVRNGKPWSYGQGELTYEKESMPAQYKYGWMDETTAGFSGLPVNILSPVSEQGKIEEIDISGYTSDVDYMLLNPSACSEDGFALLAVTEANALERDDSENYYPGFYGSHGERGVNNSYSTPLYPLFDGYTGKGGKVTVEAAGTGQAVAQFFDSDGRPVTPEVGGVDPGTVTLSFDAIPEGAVSFGFVMLSGSLDFNVFQMRISGEYELPFRKVKVAGVDYTMQNGFLAFADLIPKYLTYEMPSRNIEVNGQETTARGIQRKARQTVKFPAGTVEPDIKKIVKSSVGFGGIQSASLNLCSRMISAVLTYENDI